MRSRDHVAMSWVTTALLSCDIQDRGAVDAFNHWLAWEAPRRGDVPGAGVGSLGDLTGGRAAAWGGNKYPEAQLWGGALNHADLDAVVSTFAGLPWKVPAAAQLFLKDQEQSYFRLWMIREGLAAQYAPEPPGDDTAW